MICNSSGFYHSAGAARCLIPELGFQGHVRVRFDGFEILPTGHPVTWSRLGKDAVLYAGHRIRLSDSGTGSYIIKN